LPSEQEDRVTATDHFVMFGHVDFQTHEPADRQADRRTARQTDTLIAINRTKWRHSNLCLLYDMPCCRAWCRNWRS